VPGWTKQHQKIWKNIKKDVDKSNLMWYLNKAVRKTAAG
jgi:hypothetical protein